MKKTSVIALLLLILSCKTETKIVNPHGIYSDNELIELNEILSEFDKTLSDKYNTDNITDAYHMFSKVVADQYQVPIWKELKDLSDEVIELEVFSEVWHKNIYQNEPQGFNMNPEGKYIDYLEFIGQNTEFIKIYVDQYKSADDILPSIVGGFSAHIEELDLKDKNNRLIFAIHYLTLMNRSNTM